MTNHEPASVFWSWCQGVWSWLLLAAEAAIAVIWLITIASALSGDWPHPARWIMLLAGTGMAVSRRFRAKHPITSDSLFVVAATVMVAAMHALRP